MVGEHSWGGVMARVADGAVKHADTTGRRCRGGVERLAEAALWFDGARPARARTINADVPAMQITASDRQSCRRPVDLLKYARCFHFIIFIVHHTSIIPSPLIPSELRFTASAILPDFSWTTPVEHVASPSMAVRQSRTV